MVEQKLSVQKPEAAGRPTIVFDFGGVLFNWQPAVLIQSVLPHHAGDDAMALALAARVFESFVPGSDWSEFDRGAWSGDEVCARIASRTGLPRQDVHALMEAIPPHLAPMQATVDWLMRLAHSGERLHFLSNMPRPYKDFLQREHAFLELFHSGVFSCDVGQIKPNDDIFLTAAARFGVAPQDLVFIDDNVHNVAAALALGWRAVRFVDAAQCEAELAERGWLVPA